MINIYLVIYIRSTMLVIKSIQKNILEKKFKNNLLILNAILPDVKFFIIDNILFISWF